MNIQIHSETKSFSIIEMNFSDIKTIRDACKLYAKNGSVSATKISKQIEEILENAAF